MKTLIKLAPVVGIVAMLAACGSTMEQRARDRRPRRRRRRSGSGRQHDRHRGGAVAGAAVGAATTPRRPH
jgi:osmotically inducible lipoprotein OsmB